MKIIITENQYRKLLSENFDYSDSDSLSAIENDDELYNNSPIEYSFQLGEDDDFQI